MARVLLRAPATPPLVEGGAESFRLALRRALRDPAGRVVLRVEDAAPHRRKAARSLLQEGALAAGGQVMDGPGGDLLLVGAEAGRAERLRLLLERLVGPAAMLTWSLERDAAALVAYAAGGPAAAPRPAAEGPGLAGLDAFVDALPLDRAALRRQGLRVADGTPRPDFLRLEPAGPEIAAALGRLGADADLLDHAMRRVAARLVGALADPGTARALLGGAFPPRLHLPLPAGPGGAAAPPGRLVATLPLPDAADPAALAARAARFAAAGIPIEIEGLDAVALGVLTVEALPAAFLRLRWSPALHDPVMRDALRRLDPGRIILAGAPSPAEAAALGVVLVEAAA
jgi:hypothetical protein